MKTTFQLVLFSVFVVAMTVSTIEAQTDRARERRADRAERRAETRFERANYFNDQTWQQVNPWINENRVDPDWALRRVDRALDNAQDAQRRAAANEAASDRIERNRGGNDIDGDLEARARTDRDGGNAWYGYRDASDDARWFYDYYAVVPAYSRSTIRISEIEDVDTLKDTDASERITVSGKVDAVKKASVGGAEHLVVKLDGNGNDVDIIDLGPLNGVQKFDIRVGSELKATGWVEIIGDKDVLIARKVMTGNDSLVIQRDFNQSIDGQVVNVREVDVESVQHYLAVVESDNRRVLVDLGPVAKYETKIAPQTRVTVRGTPVRTNQQVLVMARQVKMDGRTVEIDF